MRRRVIALIIAGGTIAAIVPSAAGAKIPKAACVRIPLTKHAQIQVGYCP